MDNSLRFSEHQSKANWLEGGLTGLAFSEIRWPGGGGRLLNRYGRDETPEGRRSLLVGARVPEEKFNKDIDEAVPKY